MIPMLMPLIVVLSWLALPVGLVCIADDWVLRPRRTLTGVTRDAPLMRTLYAVLPVLIGAAVLRLLLAERLDFSGVLLAITVITGAVWGFDALVLAPQRRAGAQAAGRDPATVAEPGTVDYARSFFPVALVVLALRSFVFEPFRIPSDSMMPTLLDGDFIIVNKYAYGLRLPVLNRKILSVGEPQRGDVVVFRYPLDPSTNFIKRLVGLPGDHVEVRDNRIVINGKPVQFTLDGKYNDGCYVNLSLAAEQLGTHRHEAIFCPVALDRAPVLPHCDRGGVRGYVCGDQDAPGFLRTPPFDGIVPPGHYLMMGDNRDNSDDGRSWGYVPEENLVGRATRIWFNWDVHRSGGPIWSRIGTAIH
ncbi:MAG TPA: signal peptidase I [Steroidobacteraceae bacterium]|jgi:signal peptidase I|nr:signal peptidase I [Steroidobacteraceae bacterium]